MLQDRRNEFVQNVPDQLGSVSPGSLVQSLERLIIKGRPFEVGFECEAELYRKEHPYEH